MNPIVAPISMTVGDWSNLTRVANHALGRDIARAVDKAGISPKSPLALLSILENLRSDSQIDLRVSIREASDSNLDHLHFSFIVAADELLFYEIMELTSRALAITLSDTKTIGILSGTLKDWKHSTCTALSPSTSDGVRQIFAQVFSYFEGIGFRDLWSEYRKKQKSDSLILEHR